MSYLDEETFQKFKRTDLKKHLIESTCREETVNQEQSIENSIRWLNIFLKVLRRLCECEFIQKVH